MSRIVPPAGPLRVLALAQLANSVGDGAFYACSALFFTRLVGLSPTQVGLALTLAWAAAMLAGVPLGCLTDRWGPRRTTVLLSVATASALSAFLVVRSFPLVLLVVCGYACCQAGLASARQALLAGSVAPEERTRARAHLQSTLNAGLAIGAGLGALALSVGTRPAYLAVFVVDAVSFLAAALVLRRLPETRPAPKAPAAEPRLAVLRDRPYTLVTLLNAIMCLNMPLLSLGLPMWIVQRTGAPAAMAAVLLVVNMVGVVAFQVPVARRVTGLRSATRATRHAGGLMLVACALYSLSGAGVGAEAGVVILIVAAVVQVFGEMLQGAGSWEIGFGLAQADRQGQYQGFFGMGPQIARMLGPVLLTALLMNWGAPGWWALGGLFLIAGAAFGPAVRRAETDLGIVAP
ncbi:MFS transporter [Amycolatopsis cynarae]|uniref:MFS transporter n=1 Tax=Amycolatopsis cynarae TaxID=2995223 RepID=A0ABY7B1S6_9PSEU|nr:MFS transporter [Amycolatopsis sp. HUAS 11-8]WAL65892.1 MFS transporter [Amycolatopsis sp. HUAS 11-8]